VELSQLTADLLRTVIEDAGDLTVVATAEHADDLLERLEEVHPDVVLWGAVGTTLAERAWPVLRRHGDLPVVGIASAARAAAICRLRPQLEPLPDISGAALVDLVRWLARTTPSP
jgi:chemotaxis response regulator CheB